MISELLVIDQAAIKLGARGISRTEVAQLRRNACVIVRNPRGDNSRRLLIGRTDGGRVLTLVIEVALDPTSWIVVTGWVATSMERKILES